MFRNAGARLFVGVCLIVWAAGCGGDSPVSPASVPTPVPAVTFPVSGDYGSLVFEGTISRTDVGSSYSYTVHLSATLDRYARVNSTSSIHLDTMYFVATIPDPAKPGGSWKGLYEDYRPISADFTAHGTRVQLPDATFRLAKSLEAQAQHVGLAVIENQTRLMWPVPIELKVPCPATAYHCPPSP